MTTVPIISTKTTTTLYWWENGINALSYIILINLWPQLKKSVASLTYILHHSVVCTECLRYTLRYSQMRTVCVCILNLMSMCTCPLWILYQVSRTVHVCHGTKVEQSRRFKLTAGWHLTAKARRPPLTS